MSRCLVSKDYLLTISCSGLYFRLSISEAKTDSGLRSQLYISRSERRDSGVYKCQAVNAYGHSDHYIYLSIQGTFSKKNMFHLSDYDIFICIFFLFTISIFSVCLNKLWNSLGIKRRSDDKYGRCIIVN